MANWQESYQIRSALDYTKFRAGKLYRLRLPLPSERVSELGPRDGDGEDEDPTTPRGSPQGSPPAPGFPPSPGFPPAPGPADPLRVRPDPNSLTYGPLWDAIRAAGWDTTSMDLSRFINDLPYDSSLLSIVNIYRQGSQIDWIRRNGARESLSRLTRSMTSASMNRAWHGARDSDLSKAEILFRLALVDRSRFLSLIRFGGITLILWSSWWLYQDAIASHLRRGIDIFPVYHTWLEEIGNTWSGIIQPIPDGYQLKDTYPHYDLLTVDHDLLQGFVLLMLNPTSDGQSTLGKLLLEKPNTRLFHDVFYDRFDHGVMDEWNKAVLISEYRPLIEEATRKIAHDARTNARCQDALRFAQKFFMRSDSSLLTSLLSIDYWDFRPYHALRFVIGVLSGTSMNNYGTTWMTVGHDVLPPVSISPPRTLSFTKQMAYERIHVTTKDESQVTVARDAFMTSMSIFLGVESFTARDLINRVAELNGIDVMDELINPRRGYLWQSTIKGDHYVSRIATAAITESRFPLDLHDRTLRAYERMWYGAMDFVLRPTYYQYPTERYFRIIDVILARAAAPFPTLFMLSNNAELVPDYVFCASPKFVRRELEMLLEHRGSEEPGSDFQDTAERLILLLLLHGIDIWEEYASSRYPPPDIGPLFDSFYNELDKYDIAQSTSALRAINEFFEWTILYISDRSHTDDAARVKKLRIDPGGLLIKDFCGLAMQLMNMGREEPLDDNARMDAENLLFVEQLDRDD